VVEIEAQSDHCLKESIFSRIRTLKHVRSRLTLSKVSRSRSLHLIGHVFCESQRIICPEDDYLIREKQQTTENRREGREVLLEPS
jgi:RNase P protein component